MADYLALETTGHVLLEDGSGGLLLETSPPSGTMTKIKWGTGLVVTDEGAGVIRADVVPALPAVVNGQWIKGVGGVPVWAAITKADVSNLTTDLGAKVDKNSVVAAATRVVQNMLAAGDSQPAWRVFGDGKQEWGPGGTSTPDTNLYRSTAAANTLKTDSHFTVGGQILSSGQIYANIGAATQIVLSADGKIYFGSAADTSLYRSTAGILKTDGAIFMGNIGLPVFSGAVGGAQANKIPVYNQATGVLAGWVPLYAT